LRSGGAGIGVPGSSVVAGTDYKAGTPVVFCSPVFVFFVVHLSLSFQPLGSKILTALTTAGAQAHPALLMLNKMLHLHT